MIIYIALVSSCHPLSRMKLILRENRQEMKDYLLTLPIKQVPDCIGDIVEYNFDGRITKYYTLEQFLNS